MNPQTSTLRAAFDARVAAAREARRVTPERFVARVKAEANRRILAIIPDFKQRNATARAVELLEKRVMGEKLDARELAEQEAIRAVWARVKAIREFSDTLEAASLDTDIAKAQWPE